MNYFMALRPSKAFYACLVASATPNVALATQTSLMLEAVNVYSLATHMAKRHGMCMILRIMYSSQAAM